MNECLHDVSSAKGSESMEMNKRKTQTAGKSGNALPVAPKGNQYRRTHGINSLKKAWSQLGNRMLDGRSTAAVAIRKWRAELIADLGGAESVSTQQLAIIDLAGKQKLLLDSIDTWLLSQRTVINARKRSVIPVVIQRQQLADSLAKYMSMLGLQRRAKTTSLADLLNQNETENGDNDTAEPAIVRQ